MPLKRGMDSLREVSEIEARLKRHRDDNRYIDNQIERLETLILRMKGVCLTSSTSFAL